jgi:hypothetical protein
VFSAICIGPAVLAASTGGLPAVFAMTIFSGLTEIGLAPLLRRLRGLFPPAISGFIVAIVGIQLGVIGVGHLLGVKEQDQGTLHDEVVLSWLEDRHPGPIGSSDLILGGPLAGGLGQTLSLCGKPLGVSGRLGKTGVGPFDESYFVTFDALTDLVAFCRGSGTKAGEGQGTPSVASELEHAAANVCPPDLPPNRVSAFLLQLSAGAKIDEVKFALAQLPDVKSSRATTS